MNTPEEAEDETEAARSTRSTDAAAEMTGQYSPDATPRMSNEKGSDWATRSQTPPGSSGVLARDLVFPGDSEMAGRCCALNWASTQLGPVEIWPEALRTAVRLMLAAPVATSLWCGADYTLLYNDRYRAVLGAKHPAALGRSAAEVWGELWADIGPQFAQVRDGGQPVYAEQVRFVVDRANGGAGEEGWFTYRGTALTDGTGAVLAVYTVVVEATARVKVAADLAVERLLAESDESRRAAESANSQLQDQALELELANQQLQDQAVELEAQAEELQATARQLEERTEEAEAERARTAGILESMADAHFALDAEFRFVAANGMMERNGGIARAALLGHTIWEAFPGTVGTEFERYYRQAATDRLEAHFTHDYSDGRLELVVDVDVYPAERGGVAVFWRDVTERERSNAAREQAREALEAANEQLQEQALELELANQQLHENASELEMQAEELQATASTLEERTEEAEAGRRTVTAIVEAVADGFVAFDSELRYSYVNGRAADMWRLSPEALLGRTPREVWPGFNGSPFIAMFERVLASGTPEVMEGYASSLRAPIEMRVYPSSGGGLVAFFTDVSERRRQEEAATFMAEASRVLASSADYQTTLTNLATAAVPRLGDWCAVDVLAEPESRAWPPSIERVAVVHQDPAKLSLARTLTTRFPQDWSRETGTPGVLRTRQPMFIPDVSDAMLTAGAQNEDHLAILRELHFRSIIIVPLVARDRVLGTVTLVMAESERHFTEADLALAVDLGQRAGVALDNARLLRDAQEANSSKSHFLANMSHELRQPLNAITGYADLMTMGVRGPVTDQQREDLERIKSSSTHLTALISDILEFAKIEAGHLAYNLTSVPVDATLSEVASFIEPSVRTKHLTFSLERSDPNIAVRADRDRFIQAVLNVLTNATKYTPINGSLTVSCAITGAEHDAVAIRIADTGIGIPADKLSTIFEPFVQVNRSFKRPAEGVGLGLAIARDITRYMGGDLMVESEEGVGSTFTLTLPRA